MSHADAISASTLFLIPKAKGLYEDPLDMENWVKVLPKSSHLAETQPSADPPHHKVVDEVTKRRGKPIRRATFNAEGSVEGVQALHEFEFVQNMGVDIVVDRMPVHTVLTQLCAQCMQHSEERRCEMKDCTERLAELNQIVVQYFSDNLDSADVSESTRLTQDDNLSEVPLSDGVHMRLTAPATVNANVTFNSNPLNAGMTNASKLESGDVPQI